MMPVADLLDSFSSRDMVGCQGLGYIETNLVQRKSRAVLPQLESGRKFSIVREPAMAEEEVNGQSEPHITNGLAKENVAPIVGAGRAHIETR